MDSETSVSTATWRTLSACCAGILAGIQPAGRRAGARTTCRQEWRHGTQECVRHVSHPSRCNTEYPIMTAVMTEATHSARLIHPLGARLSGRRK